MAGETCVCGQRAKGKLSPLLSVCPLLLLPSRYVDLLILFHVKTHAAARKLPMAVSYPPRSTLPPRPLVLSSGGHE